MNRVYNFYAGPATLPLKVMEQIQREILDFQGKGLSIIETSHRSKEYETVHFEAMALVKELLQVPDNYKILLLGGGASLQFSMVPLNFLSNGNSCDFVISGSWAKKAYADAKKVGKVNVLFDGEASHYTTLPDAASLVPSDHAAYLHITSNETINGIQWQEWPHTKEVPLIADMSSDIMSRPLPLDRFGLIYAGAQKNLGPAGVTLVIIREDLLERGPVNLTAYLNYKNHAKKDSRYNTPPVFSIWAMKLVLELLKEQGGLNTARQRNREKAELLYAVIDESNGFYQSPVEKKYRSVMNVAFTLADKELEAQFLEEAASRNMVGLKGHRSVGGCRASIYNSMPKEGVEVLAELMRDFAGKN